MDGSQGVGCLSKAREIVSEERDEIEAEHEAFNSFRKRIAALDVPRPRADGGTVLPTTAKWSNQRTSVAHVRTLYRETVLSISSLRTNESLIEHVAAEFGRDLAAALQVRDRLTPQIQHALLAASRDASADRVWLAEKVDNENSALIAAADRLTRIDSSLTDVQTLVSKPQSFEQLFDAYERLNALEERCIDLLDERQKTYHDRGRHDTDSGASITFEEYLYRSASFTHPILADTLDMIQAIRQTRRNCERAVATL